MGHDARNSEDPNSTARGASAATDAGTLAASAADASAPIGYEAADPSLHAPYWSEAMQEVAKTRSLR